VTVVSYLLRHHLEAPALVRPARLVNGDDIMEELGLDPGQRVGELLAAVREAEAMGEVSSREEAIELARRHLERSSGSG
jgi:hypothetical protein